MLWRPDYYLPPEQQVRAQFESNKADYVRLADLLHKDQGVRYIDADFKVTGNKQERTVTEYGDILRRIGAKFVDVREDGSMDFALWGDGGAIRSDSYIGVRYYPKDHGANTAAGWMQTVVPSLDSAKLPRENGSIASGLYVVPIEPEWFLYRFEYRE